MNKVRNGGYFPAGFPAVGLLFLRVFVGYAMAQHGLVKIQHPFSWMDGMGPGTPGFLQALAAASEFFGGIGLVFGVLTPVCCFGIMCTMFVASLTGVLRGAPMVAPTGGPSYEIAALYFTAALSLFLTGPGLLSFDYFVFARPKEAVAVA